ncbi:UNVERIFIED_ORG: hypothetical protein FHR35_004456 [Microbispora rosea subsp. rosea]
MSSMKRMRQRAIRRLMAETGLKYTDAARELERQDKASPRRVPHPRRSRAPRSLAGFHAQIDALQRAGALPGLNSGLDSLMVTARNAALAAGLVQKHPMMRAVQDAACVAGVGASSSMVRAMEAVRASAGLGADGSIARAAEAVRVAGLDSTGLRAMPDVARIAGTAPQLRALEQSMMRAVQDAACVAGVGASSSMVRAMEAVRASAGLGADGSIARAAEAVRVAGLDSTGLRAMPDVARIAGTAPQLRALEQSVMSSARIAKMLSNSNFAIEQTLRQTRTITSAIPVYESAVRLARMAARAQEMYSWSDAED